MITASKPSRLGPLYSKLMFCSNYCMLTFLSIWYCSSFLFCIRVHTSVVAHMYIHFLNIRDIILTSDDNVMFLS